MLNGKLGVKAALTRVGAASSARAMYGLNGIFNYAYVGWWLRANGYQPVFRVPSRREIFDLIARDVGNSEVLYLEFGVAEGESLRDWARRLQHPQSHLHGFDSFLGLPHDWSLEGHPRGYFSREGRLPEFDDPRIELFPGWFDETLPKYEWPDHERLVVMLDADLYTSTATALAFVKDKLRPGSYVYFDQFHHRADELRAFNEFLDENDMTFRLAAASHELTCVAFQRVS